MEWVWYKSEEGIVAYVIWSYSSGFKSEHGFLIIILLGLRINCFTWPSICFSLGRADFGLLFKSLKHGPKIIRIRITIHYGVALYLLKYNSTFQSCCAHQILVVNF